ncbi:MAG: hypothetical protein JNK54_00015 [Elusimicrobia bacterium]|nr:hypothetical protein [Elusimicrobiota bacterium]
MTKRWVFSLSIFLLGAVAQADFNFMVQGRLSDNSGNPIGTPTAVEWQLFRDGDPATTGGTPVYIETGLISPINPQGVFSYELGSGTPVGSPLDASAYTGSNPLYALLSVAGTPLLPKLRVTPVPRSHVATLAESVQAGGVDTAALQDGSVTGVKIATSSISGSHVSNTAQLNVDRIGLGGAPATSLDLSAKTDAVRLPTGTSAERPGTPANGDTRYNNTLNAVESYVNGSWQTLSTDAGTGTAGTYTKVTTDANGRVTAGDTLAAGDIPNLDAAKITSGVLDAARIPAGTDSGKLPLTGGTMSGSIDLGGNNVTNAGTVAASTVTVGGNNVISTNAPLTSGSVLFANGAASAGQDNSNLFWDNTNKRLGVGTSNPGQPLTISAYDNSAGNYQSRKAVLRTVNTSNSTANSRFSGIQFAFRDTDAQVVAAVGAVLTDTVSDWSGDLVFATKANGFVESLTEYMRLASGGNLGIGITAPTAKLHLRSGTSAANTAPLKFTAGTNLTTPEAGAVEFDGTNLYFSTNTTNRQTFAFQGSAGTLSGLTSGSVLFANGAASAGQDNGNLFWDNTNKRLGIGTGAPLFKVQILENSATSQPSGAFTGGLENKTLMIQGSGGAYIAGKDTTNNIEFAMGVSVTGAAFAGSMTSHNFQLRTGNVPRLTIQDSNGNIGIGVTSPTSLLHLKGGTATANTAPLKFTAGTNLTTPEAGAVEFDGTNLYFSTSTTNRQTFAFQGSAGTLSGLTSGSVLFANSASSAGQDNSNFFWDNTNKRLGIGTTGPTGKLDVNQTVAGSVAVQGQNAGTVFWKVVSPAGGITGGYNAADAVEYVAKDSVTGRSINAAGTINANGADFAEWVDWEGPKPEVGSIVFYKGVHVVISSTRTAAFVGNDVKDPAHAMLVAFAGQLPVLVKGNVQEGDLIVANPDGTGRAVSRDLATMAEIQTAVGTAWASSNDSGIKRVNVAVGLGLAGGRWVDNKIKRLEGENAGLKAENKSITQRLEQIEKLLSQIKK